MGYSVPLIFFSCEGVAQEVHLCLIYLSVSKLNFSLFGPCHTVQEAEKF